jgi:Transposase DDE domain
MYLRESKQRRADDPALVERLRKLAASILRRCSPEEIVGAANGDRRLVCAWPDGEVYVLQALWQRLGIDQVSRAQAQPRRLGLDDEGGGSEDTVHGSRAAGAKTYRAPRKRGLSKNGRGDAPQIVVGLAVTREGFPVRHWVFPGNTVDVSTVAQVKRDLRDWQLTRCLFVGDAGMVSAANFKALAAAGGKYLMCMPLRRRDTLTEQVLARAGRYRTVNERLQIKDGAIGDGERRRRTAFTRMWPSRCCRCCWSARWSTLVPTLAQRLGPLRRIQLAQLLSPHGTVWQVTDPTPEAAKCLKSLQIKPPPPILQLA